MSGNQKTIIKGGTVVDGTGSPGFRADVAMVGDVISEVGHITDVTGAEVVDAEGLLVTPGFVDIHTHFDGQLTWDPDVMPSSLHGVTSIATGNCGVGFAPAAPDRHDWLISLLEGVEDIPGSALAEGLSWDWETFPEYLDALDRRAWTLDVGAHVPHAPIRVYVMGERGALHHEVPTRKEQQEMARLVAEGINAGALGFATSRTEVHRTSEGANIGTLSAGDDELLAIAAAIATTGRGVVQLISDLYQTNDDTVFASETELLRRFVEISGCPLSLTMQQTYHSPDRWRAQMAWVDGMVASGHDVKAQIAARPIGLLLGLDTTASPFTLCPTYHSLSEHPVPERAKLMRDPQIRSRILYEHASASARAKPGFLEQLTRRFDVMFRLGDPVDYDLKPERSLEHEALAEGRPPVEIAYDILCAGSGDGILYFALFNFADGDLGVVAEMLNSPNILLGLSDAGAHCRAICDASMTTSSLTLWARDGAAGQSFDLERVVHLNTQRNARHVGWGDRGVLAPGHLADVNVIDLARLACHKPRIARDLPAGGERLVQGSSGYVATYKSGIRTASEGTLTGNTPGGLIRGGRQARR